MLVHSQVPRLNSGTILDTEKHGGKAATRGCTLYDTSAHIDEERWRKYLRIQWRTGENKMVS